MLAELLIRAVSDERFGSLVTQASPTSAASSSFHRHDDQGSLTAVLVTVRQHVREVLGRIRRAARRLVQRVTTGLRTRVRTTDSSSIMNHPVRVTARAGSGLRACHVDGQHPDGSDPRVHLAPEGAIKSADGSMAERLLHESQTSRAKIFLDAGRPPHGSQHGGPARFSWRGILALAILCPRELGRCDDLRS